MDQWLKNTQNKLTAMSAGFLLVGGLVIWNFFIKGTLRQMAGFDSQTQVEAQKEETLKAIAALEQRTAAYHGRLAESAEISWLIQPLNQMAKESGLLLSSVVPDSSEPSQGVGPEKTSLTLEAKGDYHALGRFASRLENFSRFLKIRRLSIKGPSQSGEETPGGLAISLSISVYYRSEGLI